MSDETTLLPCPFCGGKAHTRMTGSGEYRLFSVDCRNIDCPCYMGGNVFHTKIEAIAAWNTRATLGSELNPDGLPNGLAISDDGTLLNWRGENYVKQATLGSGKLTAEQVREAIMLVDRWEKPMENSGLRNAHLIIREDGWQAIADELNALIGGGECVIARIAAGSDMGRCSACGQIADVASNYCWKCGAKAVKR